MSRPKGLITIKEWTDQKDSFATQIDLDNELLTYSPDLTAHNSEIITSQKIVAGDNGGSVGLTINDGYGNANIAFNHVSGKPDVSGNSARIEVNVDSTTDVSFNFEAKSGTTVDTATALTTLLNLSETAAEFKVPITINGVPLEGTALTGSSAPTSGDGNDGDVYYVI